MALIASIRDAGGIPRFEGFERSDFTWTPGRVINAFELTPNLSALAVAGLAGAVGMSDPLATLLLGRLYAVSLFPVTLAPCVSHVASSLIPERPSGTRLGAHGAGHHSAIHAGPQLRDQ